MECGNMVASVVCIANVIDICHIQCMSHKHASTLFHFRWANMIYSLLHLRNKNAISTISKTNWCRLHLCVWTNAWPANEIKSVSEWFAGDTEKSQQFYGLCACLCYSNVLKWSRAIWYCVDCCDTRANRTVASPKLFCTHTQSCTHSSFSACDLYNVRNYSRARERMLRQTRMCGTNNGIHKKKNSSQLTGGGLSARYVRMSSDRVSKYSRL